MGARAAREAEAGDRKGVRGRRGLEVDVEAAVERRRALAVDEPAAVAVGLDRDGTATVRRARPDARASRPPRRVDRDVVAHRPGAAVLDGADAALEPAPAARGLHEEDDLEAFPSADVPPGRRGDARPAHDRPCPRGAGEVTSRAESTGGRA